MKARSAIAMLAVVLASTACTATSGSTSTASGSGSASASSTSAAVSGNTCPQVLDASEADFYPIQPSFSAGYNVAAQKLDSTTQNWAYVVSGDFPYSQWMAWYLYDSKGVPLFKFSESAITPDAGSTNPFVDGNKILATRAATTST